MARTLRTSINLIVQAVLTSLDGRTVTKAGLPTALQYNWTETNQDQIFESVDRTTPAPTANQDLDISGGLVNSQGETVTLAKVHGLILYNKGPATITLGGAATAWETWTTQAGSKISVPTGGLIMLINPVTAGYAVTAGTGDLLKIAAGTGASTLYDLFIIGKQ